MEQGRSPRTLDAYARDLVAYEQYIESRGHDVLRSTSEDIEQYILLLRNSGKAAKSVARSFAAIRMLHRYLSDESIRSDNPASNVDGVKVPNDDEQKVIHHMKQMKCSGASLRDIQSWLTATQGRTFSRMGVRDILSRAG